MRTRTWSVASIALILVASGCGQAQTGGTPASAAASEAPSGPAMAESVPMVDMPLFEEIEPGSYHVDPDGDPDTSMRVTFEVAAPGWTSWVGTGKGEEGDEAGIRIVALTVAAPSHVVSDPCTEESWDDPGPGVDDLADALANLPGFELTVPVSDVTAYGYAGKHLELQVPDDIPFEHGGFVGCSEAEFKSWRSDTERGRILDRFYQGPGHLVEFWILDVEGSRLLLEASRFPDSLAADVAELQAVLDSIHIDP